MNNKAKTNSNSNTNTCYPIFPLTSMKPLPLPFALKHKVTKCPMLIKAEKKNKHLVKLLNNKIFTGYRKTINEQMYISQYNNKRRMLNGEITVYPFQEEYEAIYKHKYLPSLKTTLNWKQSVNIKKVTFNSNANDQSHQAEASVNDIVVYDNNVKHVYCQTSQL